MKGWIAVVLLLLLGVVAHAQESFPDALKRIASAKVFAFGGIGFSGTISDGEIDFRVIMARPPKAALNAFEKLYASDNPQTKAYALAGIRKLDKAKFKELQLTLRLSELQVQTEEGCIVSEQLLRRIAEQLDSGRYDYWIK